MLASTPIKESLYECLLPEQQRAIDLCQLPQPPSGRSSHRRAVRGGLSRVPHGRREFRCPLPAQFQTGLPAVPHAKVHSAPLPHVH